MLAQRHRAVGPPFAMAGLLRASTAVRTVTPYRGMAALLRHPLTACSVTGRSLRAGSPPLTGFARPSFSSRPATRSLISDSRPEPIEFCFSYAARLPDGLSREQAEDLKNEITQILRREAKLAADKEYQEHVDRAICPRPYAHVIEDVCESDYFEASVDTVWVGIKWLPPKAGFGKEAQTHLSFHWPEKLGEPKLEGLEEKGVADLRRSTEMYDPFKRAWCEVSGPLTTSAAACTPGRSLGAAASRPTTSIARRTPGGTCAFSFMSGGFRESLVETAKGLVRRLGGGREREEPKTPAANSHDQPRKEHFNHVCLLRPGLTREKAEQVKDEVTEILRRRAYAVALEKSMEAEAADEKANNIRPPGVVTMLLTPSQEAEMVLYRSAKSVRTAVEWSSRESSWLLFFNWPPPLGEPDLKILREHGVGYAAQRVNYTATLPSGLSREQYEAQKAEVKRLLRLQLQRRAEESWSPDVYPRALKEFEARLGHWHVDLWIYPFMEIDSHRPQLAVEWPVALGDPNLPGLGFEYLEDITCEIARPSEVCELAQSSERNIPHAPAVLASTTGTEIWHDTYTADLLCGLSREQYAQYEVEVERLLRMQLRRRVEELHGEDAAMTDTHERNFSVELSYYPGLVEEGQTRPAIAQLHIDWPDVLEEPDLKALGLSYLTGEVTFLVPLPCQIVGKLKEDV